MSDKINNGELKTGSAINAKSEALYHLHNLSFEELDAVSGGAKATLENAQQAAEDKKAGDQIKAFEQLLQEI